MVKVFLFLFQQNVNTTKKPKMENIETSKENLKLERYVFLKYNLCKQMVKSTITFDCAWTELIQYSRLKA